MWSCSYLQGLRLIRELLVRPDSSSRVRRTLLHFERLEARWLPAPILVQDLNTNTMSSSPVNLIASGGQAFFVADDGLHGRQVWKSDGTAADMVTQPTPATSADNGPGK